jgi:hypothetical protein
MNHIHTLKLHQLRLGELAPAEEGRLRAHLATCAQCTARLKHQQELRQEFLREPMPDALRPRRPLWERVRGWLPGVALIPAAAAVALVLNVRPPGGPEGPIPTPPPAPTEVAPPVPVAPPTAPTVAPAATIPEPVVAPRPPVAPKAGPEGDGAPTGIRTKGRLPRLEAWVPTGESARPMYTGEAIGAGERVQLRFDARGRAFVTLAGRDTNGLVEVYGTLPGGDNGLRAAPFALTLDDTSGEQTFFALYTDERPEPESVIAALRHNPVRMEGADVASVVVRKD